jgi:hypothetical protein
VTFEFLRLRLHFRAAEPLFFPPGKSANILRGALGAILYRTVSAPEYARLFAPKAARGGPSGLAEQPRPFVFRAAHLDGMTIAPGAGFHFDLHLFDVRELARRHLEKAFAQLVRFTLVQVEQEDVAIELDDTGQPAACVRVRFVTPTELKAGHELVTRPEFSALFARLRDRISTLRAFYGAGPLDIDFRGMGQRAAQVRLSRCELQWIESERRSASTGQTHPLGGFTGDAEYQGNLGEFLPYLRAGQWTGVGRQTVWGKGEICIQLFC